MTRVAAPTPAMLRVYGGDKIGSTAFFRNRPLLDALLGLVRSRGKPDLRVLFHASSIGAEPYSLAAWAIMAGLAETIRLQITATDINADFLAVARAGVYPSQVLAGMTEAERECFVALDDGEHVGVRDDVRQMVEFIEPASFVDFETERRFDIVFVLNALTYVTADDQHRALQSISHYNDWLLVTSAFHPDSIRDDLVSAGYRPLTTALEAIHGGWVERIRPVAARPGTPEYSWVLPPFSRIAEHEFRFCALFEKSAAAEAAQRDR